MKIKDLLIDSEFDPGHWRTLNDVFLVEVVGVTGVSLVLDDLRPVSQNDVVRVQGGRDSTRARINLSPQQLEAASLLCKYQNDIRIIVNTTSNALILPMCTEW